MKSFIYLDKFKMYSLSSQLMEGVTEYILEEKRNITTDELGQKGPVASGRIMAEIIEKTSANYEKKFLHDYAYSIFEKRLEEINKYINIDSSTTLSDIQETVKHSQIVRVKGKAKIVDFLAFHKSLTSMEAISQALGVVTHNGERESILMEMEAISGGAGSKKGEIQQLNNRLKSLSDPKAFGQDDNTKLYQKYLAQLLDMSFGDTLELAMEFSDFKVSADMDRDCLRESERSLVKKYSRLTEVEFVMLGVVTQVGELEGQQESQEITEDHSMRDAMTMNISALSAMENSLRQRRSNEIILDPLAVYVEL
ncbi:MAG: hypothetical protein AB7E55_18295 [Pigmentiphaga sp.]